MNTNKASTAHLLALATFLTTTFFLAQPGMSAESAVKNDKVKFAYDEETKKTTGPKDLIVWESPTRVTFDHQFHTKDAGMSCESCHDDIFTMKAGTAVEGGTFTMAAMAEGQFCGACHDGSTAFSTTTQCASCHTPPDKPIVFSSPVKAVAFDHSLHLKKGGLACEACHKEVFKMKVGSIAENELAKATPEDKRAYLEELHNKYCGTCHDSSQAFGYLTRCTVCHIGVKGFDELPGNKKKEDAHGAAKH